MKHLRQDEVMENSKSDGPKDDERDEAVLLALLTACVKRSHVRREVLAIKGGD